MIKERLSLALMFFSCGFVLVAWGWSQPKYIEQAGMGVADSSISNATQRRATSREAAIVVAKFKMLDYLQELDLPDGSTVGEKMSRDENFSKTVKELVSSCPVVSASWAPDDACTVVVRLKTKKITSVVGKVHF